MWNSILSLPQTLCCYSWPNYLVLLLNNSSPDFIILVFDWLFFFFYKPAEKRLGTLQSKEKDVYLGSQ